MTEAFSGDRLLQNLVLSLIDTGATAFVETGTWWGYTSGWVATMRPLVPVFTCDVTASFLVGARWALSPHVRLFNTSGEQFIELVASQVGDLPIFFLDAHWLDYWPLEDELRAIAANYSQAIIIVHDLYVPHCEAYHYDTYNGVALDINLVHAAILERASHDYLVYFPLPPDIKAGYAVIFQDVEPSGLCLGKRYVEWDGVLNETDLGV